MSEIVVVGAFTALPGKEGVAREVLESLIVPTHAEDGCILYALNVGADDPARLTFVERWASRDALDAHLATDHISAALGRLDELFTDHRDITVFEAVPGGDATKGSLAGHAGSA
jgi:quinol monooxygenase YgiN